MKDVETLLGYITILPQNIQNTQVSALVFLLRPFAFQTREASQTRRISEWQHRTSGAMVFTVHYQPELAALWNVNVLRAKRQNTLLSTQRKDGYRRSGAVCRKPADGALDLKHQAAGKLWPCKQGRTFFFSFCNPI